MSTACVVDFLCCGKEDGSTVYTRTAEQLLGLEQINFEPPCKGLQAYFQNMVRNALADVVEAKTISMIEDMLLEKDREIWHTPEGRKKVLAKARTNFGGNAYDAIFAQQLFGLNKRSEIMTYFLKNVANSPALDVAYNARGDFYLSGLQIWPAFVRPDTLSNFFFKGDLERGVRNRYRIVRALFEKAVETVGSGMALSVACGSAQPIVDAVHRLALQRKGRNIELLLTDSEEASLKLARMRAGQAGILNKVRMQQLSIKRIHKDLEGLTFRIAELCGIFDYFEDEGITRLLRTRIFPLMEKGGILIASGMNEIPLYSSWLRRLYNWEIIYRTPQTFARLLEEAGFVDVKVVSEPCGIYYVATARKP